MSPLGKGTSFYFDSGMHFGGAAPGLRMLEGWG